MSNYVQTCSYYNEIEDRTTASLARGVTCGNIPASFQLASYYNLLSLRSVNHYLMSRNYKFRDQNKIYFISFATVSWIDALTRPDYKTVIIDSILYCIENKGLEVYGWVIMSNHVHMIIGSHKNRMEDIVRDLKRHTSKNLLTTIANNLHESRREWMLWMFERAGKRNPNNTNYQFWQQHNHPIELFTNEMMDQKLEYIHNNPVVEGIVNEAYHYRFSSAIDYSGGKGLIPIVFIQ